MYWPNAEISADDGNLPPGILLFYGYLAEFCLRTCDSEALYQMKERLTRNMLMFLFFLEAIVED